MTEPDWTSLEWKKEGNGINYRRGNGESQLKKNETELRLNHLSVSLLSSGTYTEIYLFITWCDCELFFHCSKESIFNEWELEVTTKPEWERTPEPSMAYPAIPSKRRERKGSDWTRTYFFSLSSYSVPMYSILWTLNLMLSPMRGKAYSRIGVSLLQNLNLLIEL